jgi:hypothetical protein
VVTIKPATHVADRNNAPTANGMLAAPILSTLVRLSLPNMLAIARRGQGLLARHGRLGSSPRDRPGRLVADVLAGAVSDQH